MKSAPIGPETLPMIDHIVLAIDIMSTLVFSLSVVPKILWYIRFERQLLTEGAKPILHNVLSVHAASAHEAKRNKLALSDINQKL